MTGAHGDHHIADIRTLHCTAPNARDTPRIMLAVLFTAAHPDPTSDRTGPRP
jgi:hypothetical protein